MKMNIKVGILPTRERPRNDTEGKSNSKMGYLHVMDTKLEYCPLLVLPHCGVTHS